MHIISMTIKYSYTGHPRIASTSCRAKSWELAIAFMLNGGYYADYASIYNGHHGVASNDTIVHGTTLCLG